jgi:hypothetical protein
MWTTTPGGSRRSSPIPELDRHRRPADQHGIELGEQAELVVLREPMNLGGHQRGVPAPWAGGCGCECLEG